MIMKKLKNKVIVKIMKDKKKAILVTKTRIVFSILKKGAIKNENLSN